jgi:hypothetical protein
MTFTLWSKGRLLGESPLDFVRCMPRHRMGFLQPTPVGERLLPVASGVSPAMTALSRAVHRRCENEWEDLTGAERQERMRTLTEFADVAAAQAQCDALELELRRADGTVVPTEWIDVRDTEYLLELAREFEEDDERREAIFGERPTDPELEAAIEHDLAVMDELHGEDEPDLGIDDEPEWPRYQLQIMLRDDLDLP